MKKTAIILIMALAFFACDDKGDNNTNDDNVIKERTATRTLTGGIGSVTVKGNLTKPQLDDSADKIAGRLNARFADEITQWGETAVVDYYKVLFDRGVIYIVETNPEYNNFKTIGDGKTVYIALDKVDTTYVVDGMWSIYDNGVYPPPDNTPQPVTETHTIVLATWQVTFDIKYEKLPSDPMPEYVNYLAGRFLTMDGVLDETPGWDAMEHLVSKGNRFTVRIKYTDNSFEGMNWNTATQEFEIHHNWISVPDVNLSAAMIRTAFNAVETE